MLTFINNAPLTLRGVANEFSKAWRRLNCFLWFGVQSNHHFGATVRFVRRTARMKPFNCSYSPLSEGWLSTAVIASSRTRKCIQRVSQVFGFVGIVLCFVSSAPAQMDRAGLEGTVTDSSGRVLPQAHITLVQDATGLRRRPHPLLAEPMTFPSCQSESTRSRLRARGSDRYLGRCRGGYRPHANAQCKPASFRTGRTPGSVGRFGTDGSQQQRGDRLD